jgi:hypothetical protein
MVPAEGLAPHTPMAPPTYSVGMFALVVQVSVSGEYASCLSRLAGTMLTGREPPPST